jgi:hypothetical protein
VTGVQTCALPISSLWDMEQTRFHLPLGRDANSMRSQSAKPPSGKSWPGHIQAESRSSESADDAGD